MKRKTQFNKGQKWVKGQQEWMLKKKTKGRDKSKYISMHHGFSYEKTNKQKQTKISF